MKRKLVHRLPAVKTLYELLPKGAEGGKEFGRLMDLLLFHEGRRSDRKVGLFSDVSGDYHGLDSFSGDMFRKEGTTGYQYKFFPSPLSDEHRTTILQSLERTQQNQRKLKLKKWVLITPENLIESSRRKTGGDVTWFEGLRKKLKLRFELEHWGHNQILALFIDTPTLALFYYPELVPDGAAQRKTIQETRGRYDENLMKLYGDIQFVGMNVRKQEATKGVPIEHIYIPLTVIPEAADDQDENIARTDPLTLLSRGARRLILGDPGSGKSTLLKFLALVGICTPLQRRYGAAADPRLPIFVTLRRYADELKRRPNLSLIRHIREVVQSDFNLVSANQAFFEYYLESGQAMLYFDGLDELPGSHFKEKVRNQIRALITTYPGNTAMVTSRIVGYDNPFRFDEKEFTHHRLTKLRLPEMKQFVEDWYKVRIENDRDRADHVRSLVQILENPDQRAIYDLAENPLLLTIIALVHRIDGVLPDARVVLYKICTETLLESWHRWKFRDLEAKYRGREERRNKQRMEAIAHWMQLRSVGTGKTQRAVVPYSELHAFLTSYIKNNEKQTDPNEEPQDSAREFLQFVKERAGLLVELGDTQYSFVHLTFQEYLTAAYIKTQSELHGIAEAWQKIKDICYEPRWHEVVRLLIAGLDSNASQRFLVEQLLADNANGQQAARAHLLGGLLLDTVEAAEDHEADIIKELLKAGIKASDVEELRPTNTLLSSWLIKDKKNEAFLGRTIKSFNSGQSQSQNHLNLVLLTTAVGISKSKQLELSANFFDAQDLELELFQLLLGEQPVDKVSPQLLERMTVLWAIQDYYCFNSAEANLVAAACQTVTARLPPRTAAKRLFEQQLISLFGSNLLGYGPFSEFCYASSLLMDDHHNMRKLVSKRKLDHSPARRSVLYDAVTVARGDKRNQERNPVATRIKAFSKSRPVNISERIHALKPVAAGLMRNSVPDFSDPQVYPPVVDTICDGLSLERRPQWWEAMRADLVPKIRTRIPQFDTNTWIEAQRRLQQKTATEADSFIAAWQLFFDAWLFFYGCYDSRQESPFQSLASITRADNAPALEIAHCIRDLAFGDTSRSKDLSDMINSEAPGYRSIFEQCHLYDKSDQKRRRARTQPPKRISKKVSLKK